MRSSNTMKYVSVESRAISLISPFQGCKDVEEKLLELVMWLSKLKDSVVTTSADVNGEEAKRRDQLARFLSYPCCLAGTTQFSTLDR